MEIQQKFVVDGQEFSSIEEAQAYVDSQQDRRRVDAFVAHLKASGKAERVSKKQTDLILEFIQYEESVREGFELEQPGKPAQPAKEKAADTSAEAETHKQSTESAPTAKEVEEGSDPKPGSAGTAEEAAGPSSEPAQDAEESGGSQHVDGPDETLEEDPLAGLDI